MAEEAKLSEVDLKDGLIRIAVVYTGDYIQNGVPRKFTEKDLENMRARLSERETPIDYEHLSAQPVPPGWGKAAAWFSTKPGEIEDFTDGRKILYAWAQFTPACLSMIANKEYRYFSPEPHWNERNEKGKNIGTVVAAGAVTNRPFLKDLPPIDISMTDYPKLLQVAAMSESARMIDVRDVHVPANINDKEKTMADKKITFKKSSMKGTAAVFADGEQVGMCDKATMKAYMTDEDPDEPSSEDVQKEKDAKMSETVTACFSELSKITDGTKVTAMSETFVEQGKFDMRAFLRAQKIERLVSEGIAKGKILPKQRAAFFSMAVADYDNAVAFMNEQKSVVDTTTHGISGDGTVTDEAKAQDTEVKAYMTEHEVDQITAFKKVAQLNPERYERVKRMGTAADRE